MDKYRAAGGSVLTPYFYNGTQLELPALLLAMEDIQTRFRDHINAWTAGRIEGALSFHDHMEGLQLLDRIGRDYMRMFISYYGLPFPESNCGRCGAYPGTMGAKHGVKNEGILIDCPTKMEPCAFCKVVFSCVPDVGVKMLEGNSELHPTGCHSKDVCPYMRSNYQHYMAFIVHKIAGIHFISKQYNPVGGMSQGQMGASQNQKFSDSLGGL